MADDRQVFEEMDKQIASVISGMQASLKALSGAYDSNRKKFREFDQKLTDTINKNVQSAAAAEKTRKNQQVATDLIQRLNKSTTSLASSLGLTGTAAAQFSRSTQTANGIIAKLAQSEKLKGSAVESSTNSLIQVSNEHKKQKDELARTKNELGNFGNSLLGRIEIQNKETELARAGLAVTEAGIKRLESLMSAQDELIQKARDESAQIDAAIAAKQDEINATGMRIHSIQQDMQRQGQAAEQAIAKKASIETEIAQIQAIIKSDQLRKTELENSTAAQRAHTQMLHQRMAQESEAMRATQEGIDAQYSELAAVQTRMQQISDELNDENLTAQQRSSLQALVSRELSQLAQKEQLLEAQIGQSEMQLVAQQAQLQSTSAAWRSSQSELFANEAQLAKVTSDLQASGQVLQTFESSLSRLEQTVEEDNKLIQQGFAHIESLQAAQQRQVGELNELTGKQLKQNAIIDEENKAREMLAEQHAEATEKLKNDQQKFVNDQINKYAQRLSEAAGMVAKVSDVLNKLVDSVRTAQKEFGLSAGTAAKVKFENLTTSINSYASSLASGGRQAAVSVKEIEAAQTAFQSEFGGVLTSEAAGDIARQAKEMGVGAGELAKARRVFMTQTMGDTGAAKAAQDKFVSEFAKKGLTSKDAMAAIGANSELLARNGTRFAASFARAAAEAKKIGVDLGKIDQVGDNIIGDFEGFLESQAELGAMGFGFDSSRLAEVAESGDTGALMEELRSQLAAQGKDLTKLRRSEQLALSKSFGISMEELQRMAAPPGTEGSGEATLSPEELQKGANKSLERLVNLGELAGVALGGLATIMGVVAKNTSPRLVKSIVPGLPNILGPKTPPVLGPALPPSMGGPATAGSVMKRIFTPTGMGQTIKSAASPVGNIAKSLVSPVSKGVKIGGSALAGIFGAIEGFTTAKKEGKATDQAAGAAAVQGGLAAVGTALGAAGGPLGMMIGGWIGNTFGKAINKYFPGVSEGLGKFFSGLMTAFTPLKEAFGTIIKAFTPLKEAFMSIFGIFSGPGGETSEFAKQFGSILKEVGSIIGTYVLIPLNLLAVGLRGLVGGITLVFDVLSILGNLIKGVFTRDFSGLEASWNQFKEHISGLFKDMWNLIKAPFVSIFTSIGNLLPGWAKKMMGISTESSAATTAQPAAQPAAQTAAQPAAAPGGPSVMSRMGNAISGFFGGKEATTGDDVISRSGYGSRVLVTPQKTVALNNNDNVVAYADDMVSDAVNGIKMLSYGALSRDSRGTAAAPPTISAPNVDLSKLEAKLDQVVNAIGRMNVEMDGQKVGKILVGRTDSATTVGVMRRG